MIVRDQPDLLGRTGTNGQHSFYQLIHQGTRLVPCDFIAFTETLNPLGHHHAMLLANGFAQGEALAFGKTPEEVKGKARRTGWFRIGRSRATGRRTRSARALTPAALGKLVALYEHLVFTQGVIWNVDSFDQWGVELGKALAKRIIPELDAGAPAVAESRQLDERADPAVPPGQQDNVVMKTSVSRLFKQGST